MSRHVSWSIWLLPLFLPTTGWAAGETKVEAQARVEAPHPPVSQEPNGFAALAVFDEAASGGNGDGVISVTDAVYERLGLWIDSNHDAVSQPHEVTPLSSEGIQAIDLTPVVSQRRDRYGNRSKWASHVLFLHSLRLAAVDVIFLAE